MKTVKTIGIYQITNTINNKVYIGQSWDIYFRWKNEKLGGSLNSHLESSIQKYGLDNFNFEVILEIDPSIATQPLLDQWEDFFIVSKDAMNPGVGYNKKRGGSNGKLSEESKKKISDAQIGKKMSTYSIEKRKQTIANNGGYSHSEETKEKLRAIHMGKKRSKETRERIGNGNRGKIVSSDTRLLLSELNKGKKHTEETKEKLRTLNLGEKNHFFGKKHSEESREKISKSKLGRKMTEEQRRKNHGSLGYKKSPESIAKTVEAHKKPVKCVETDVLYPSVKDASYATGIGSNSISRSASGSRTTAGGYHWMYV